jgi:peroxin-19
MMGDGGAAAGLAAGAGAGAGADAAGGADFQNFQQSLEGGADAFAKQLEDSGIPPGDFLKQLLADVMAEEGGSGAGMDAAAALSGATSSPAPAATASSTPGVNSDQPAESFNEAIQRTMERMQDSGNRATEAASADDGLSEDMLAQLLKAVEAGASGGGEDGGDLTKMFMGMMEQLSNKEMLYEPMKELDGKFGPWIEKNKTEGKVPAADMERYETQARIVKQIVTKFEETGYSDEDPKCREYVWERMQEVSLALFLSLERLSHNMLIPYRCKQLGAHRRNSFPTLSWVILEEQLRERCPRECPIARNNKMIPDIDFAHLSACFVLYIYVTASIPNKIKHTSTLFDSCCLDGDYLGICS